MTFKTKSISIGQQVFYPNPSISYLIFLGNVRYHLNAMELLFLFIQNILFLFLKGTIIYSKYSSMLFSQTEHHN